MVRFKSRVVTEGNIADDSVTTAKILNGTITNAKMGVASGHFIVFAQKTALETVNNSSTFQDDDHLVSASLAASSEWIIEIYLCHSTAVGGTPDIKVQIVIPTGATHTLGGTAASTTDGANIANLGTDGAASIAYSAGSSAQMLYLVGRVSIGATAGTVQLQWAQNVATVEDLTVRTRCWMLLRRLS